MLWCTPGNALVHFGAHSGALWCSYSGAHTLVHTLWCIHPHSAPLSPTHPHLVPHIHTRPHTFRLSTTQPHSAKQTPTWPTRPHSSLHDPTHGLHSFPRGSTHIHSPLTRHLPTLTSPLTHSHQHLPTLAASHLRREKSCKGCLVTWPGNIAMVNNVVKVLLTMSLCHEFRHDRVPCIVLNHPKQWHIFK